MWAALAVRCGARKRSSTAGHCEGAAIAVTRQRSAECDLEGVLRRDGSRRTTELRVVLNRLKAWA